MIEDVGSKPGAIRIATSPIRQASFFFDGAAGGHVVEAEPERTLTGARWSFEADRRRCRWIRVEVVDQAGNCAWTNPLAVSSSR